MLHPATALHARTSTLRACSWPSARSQPVWAGRADADEPRRTVGCRARRERDARVDFTNSVLLPLLVLLFLLSSSSFVLVLVLCVARRRPLRSLQSQVTRQREERTLIDQTLVDDANRARDLRTCAEDDIWVDPMDSGTLHAGIYEKRARLHTSTRYSPCL